MLTLQIHGLFDITMRFKTLINQRMYNNEFFDYYVNYENVQSPMACISLCKKDDSCMTATFNLTSKLCSFSAMQSMHEGDRQQQFETSFGVNSYVKFRHRGMYITAHEYMFMFIRPDLTYCVLRLQRLMPIRDGSVGRKNILFCKIIYQYNLVNTFHLFFILGHTYFKSKNSQWTSSQTFYIFNMTHIYSLFSFCNVRRPDVIICQNVLDVRKNRAD